MRRKRKIWRSGLGIDVSKKKTNMMKYIILIFILLYCISANAQWLGNGKDNETGYIIVDLSEKDSLSYSKSSDTTHYYVVFENFFEDNDVRVYCNDSLIYKDKISSDYSIELAAQVKVGHVKSVKKISIGIEDLPLIVVYPTKGKYYIRVRCSSFPFIHLRFSKYDIIRR